MWTNQNMGALSRQLRAARPEAARLCDAADLWWDPHGLQLIGHRPAANLLSLPSASQRAAVQDLIFGQLLDWTIQNVVQ